VALQTHRTFPVARRLLNVNYCFFSHRNLRKTGTSEQTYRQ